ncbi:T9SS type B sorting domain-containing protein [Maribacter antarcticus]|uniref:T9SS type B sorting domain-containing protein n=1 Tax=Maribacter antarcticus TaxID=505250 RepID=UPI00068513F2|nr:T9SS type B sorting domain-containing protein [Maribacter antarcticus]
MELRGKQNMIPKNSTFKGVKKNPLKSLFLFYCIIGFFSKELSGQLGFCSGNSGSPIFTEDFGSGLTNGPALPVGTTTYNFVTSMPSDGNYTISSTTNFFDWHNVPDHTPGDVNGKAFVVNASFTAGEFYQRPVTGLCENTSYEFSAWLINLLPQSSCEAIGIPVNVRFQIWDETDTNLLAQGDTGDIPNRNAPLWEQYALVFKTLPGQTSVILKMRNNSNGGCGNDLAIDDIAFSSCGDAITLSNDQNEMGIISCEGQGGITTTLEATPDGSIFTSYAYQWQQSNDQVLWIDIPAANNSTFSTPTINTTTYFRTKVAEDIINLSNDLCNVISDVFEIILIPTPQPPVSNGNVSLCENEETPLLVSVPVGTAVNWYDAPTGGALLAEKTVSFTPTVSGTYFAEAFSGSIDCSSDTRTMLIYTINPIPRIIDEVIEICDGSTIIISADLDNVSYVWNTGEITEEISIITPGEYTVMATNLEGCSNTKSISVVPVTLPIIKNIKSDGSNIIVDLENTGQFEFTLDNGAFQTSPLFETIIGGRYTINIRYGDNCGMISQEFIHLVVPKFFTPNADGNNDLFLPEGLEYFTSYELSIFNRFGQLLKNTSQNNPAWDGTFNGAQMPSGNYWYRLRVEGTVRNGYFVLKQ